MKSQIVKSVIITAIISCLCINTASAVLQSTSETNVQIFIQ